MKNIDWVKLVISVLFPLTIGLIGSSFTMAAIPVWYEGLNKPAFNPPNEIFGPVWTFLYVLMGIAFYIVWNTKKHALKSIALSFFIFQIVLNLLWSFLFFGVKSPLLALIEIFVLWSMILVTLILFYWIKRQAGWLMVPYLAWVTFATILNFSIVVLNT